MALAEVRKALEWNWPLAETAYRKAIALSPSCEAAHRAFAVFLAALSRFPEAKAEADRACDLDPLCLTVSTSAAWVRYAAGDFDEAIDRCRHTLDMDPDFAPARRLLGAAHLGAGQSQQAVAELTAAVGPDGTPLSLSWLAHAKAAAGMRDEATSIVTRLEGLAKESYVPPYHLALAQVGLGDRDAAFALLARASIERDPALMNVCVEPRFEPLRRDPRYQALVDELGIGR